MDITEYMRSRSRAQKFTTCPRTKNITTAKECLLTSEVCDSRTWVLEYALITSGRSISYHPKGTLRTLNDRPVELSLARPSSSESAEE